MALLINFFCPDPGDRALGFGGDLRHLDLLSSAPSPKTAEEPHWEPPPLWDSWHLVRGTHRSGSRVSAQSLPGTQCSRHLC